MTRTKRCTRWVIGGVLCAAFAAIGAGALGGEATAPEQAITKGPYLQNATQNSMTIMWETALEGPSAVDVQKLPDGKPVEKLGKTHVVPMDPPPEPKEKPAKAGAKKGSKKAREKEAEPEPPARTAPSVIHEVVVDGLEAGASYKYRVRTGAASSPWYTFRTLKGPGEKIKFAVYGDSRGHPEVHKQIADAILREKADFALHSGDIVGDGRKYEPWGRLFFEPAADMLHEVPFFPALGNHEEKAHWYFDFYSVPEPENYYSFDAGDVHVIVIDCYKMDKEQKAFIRDDLAASKKPWKVAVFHVPWVSPGPRGPVHTGLDFQTGRLLEAGKVDLVFTGHKHLYHRALPIIGDNGHVSWHIVCAGGGAPIYKIKPCPITVSYLWDYNYCILTATATRVECRAYTKDGKLIDRFAIEKKAGQDSAVDVSDTLPDEGPMVGIRPKLLNGGRPIAKADVIDTAKFDRALEQLKRSMTFTVPKGAETADVVLTVTNPSKKPREAKISFANVEGGWKVEPPERTLKIEPGGAVKAAFKVKFVPGDRRPPHLKIESATSSFEWPVRIVVKGAEIKGGKRR